MPTLTLTRTSALYRDRPGTFSYEKNDCSVRALMVGAGVDYAAAHAACYAVGRKPRAGMYDHDFTRAVQKLCPAAIVQHYNRKSEPSVIRFAEQHPTGAYVVSVRWHFLAIVDGVVHDWDYSRPTSTNGAYRQIMTSWKLR